MHKSKYCILVAILCLLIFNSTNAAAVKFRVKTVATGLTGPRSVYVVSNGDMYVGEYSVNRVRKITASGTYSVFVGPSTNSPTVVANSMDKPFIWIDEPSSKLYISEAPRISVVDMISKSYSIVTTNVQFPRMITVAGNRVFYADYGYDSETISYFTIPTPPVTVQYMPAVHNPEGVAVSPDGVIFFTDAGSDVKKFDSISVSYSSTYIPGLNAPIGLFCTLYNELFIAETGTRKILKNVLGTTTDFAGSSSGMDCPEDSEALTCAFGMLTGLFVTTKNEVYVPEVDKGTVKKIYPYCDSGFQLSSEGRSCDPICSGKVGTAACGGPTKGTCNAPELCVCTTNYFGAECTVTTCDGNFSNTTAACNNHGTCTDLDTCKCNAGWTGFKCDIAICNGTFSNDTSVCSSRGQCVGPDNCNCNDTNYGGSYCSLPKCGGILSDNRAVCSANGTCNGLNSCQCNALYTGTNCEIPICFGIQASQTATVCNGQGTCVLGDKCICKDYSKYTGANCNITICNSKLATDRTVCNSRGLCSAPNSCICNDTSLFGGVDCELFKCYDALSNQGLVCSGKGACQANSYFYFVTFITFVVLLLLF